MTSFTCLKKKNTLFYLSYLLFSIHAFILMYSKIKIKFIYNRLANCVFFSLNHKYIWDLLYQFFAKGRNMFVFLSDKGIVTYVFRLEICYLRLNADSVVVFSV